MAEFLRRHPSMITRIMPAYIAILVTYVAVGLTLGWFH